MKNVCRQDPRKKFSATESADSYQLTALQISNDPDVECKSFCPQNGTAEGL